MIYKMRIQASKLGSIGTKYCEKRSYFITAKDEDEAVTKAIKEAYEEGLEHVVASVVERLEIDF